MPDVRQVLLASLGERSRVNLVAQGRQEAQVAAALVPGRHEITLTDSETGTRVSQHIVAESL